MAIGSGKTRTVISLIDVLTRHDWVKNVLFLADRTALVRQGKNNFNYLLPNMSLCNLQDSRDNPESRIIFTKSHQHAIRIVERFNSLYPGYKGEFARIIDNQVNYSQDLIDRFSDRNKLPQLAVSVDMLDTGIDIAEVVNLVFFKRVRFKAKFWQMIGRGTRLCEDLFGVGIHKEYFYIFDFCGNFEFFRANPNGIEVKVQESLTEKIFNTKVELIKELQHLDYQQKEYINYRDKLIQEVLGAIK